MTNADVMNCQRISSLSEEMSRWIWDNYTKIPDGVAVPDCTWETACRDGNDWKYGRFKICRDKMLVRNLTFSEFYGGGIVD